MGLAVVEPAPGAQVTLDDLLTHADGRLGRFKWPKHMVTIDELPRNATLKIDRAALKRRYGGASPV